jgi:hypothetical protein
MKRSLGFSILAFLIIIGYCLSSCTRTVPNNVSQNQTTEIQSGLLQTPQNNVLEIVQETEASVNSLSTSTAQILSIIVANSNGEPVDNAIVIIKNEKGQVVGEKRTGMNGVVIWDGLPDDVNEYTVFADGYISGNGMLSISDAQVDERVVLTLDPHSLSAELACRPDEALLYKEDFQDGSANGWDDFGQVNTGWEIVDRQDDPGNSVLLANSPSKFGAILDGEKFGDMVWRLMFMVVEPFEGQLGFKWMCENGVCYQLEIQYDQYNETLSRVDQNEIHVLSDSELPPPETNQWHLLELSSYQGLVWVFLDGEEYATYLDIDPLLQGTIGLDLSPFGGSVLLDNFSVCGLNSPLIPLHMELPLEE